MITNEQKALMLEQYYDRGVLKKEVRSYEVSLWTLQDEFITVLKWSDVEQKGRIEHPIMTINIDGTEKLTFSIPMYYREKGELVENPNWYNTRNGNIIKGLRKVKVIFNKQTDDERVFEFLIINVEEKHEEDVLTCEIECDGMFFQELGKRGYKVNLSQANFELIYNEWADTGVWHKKDGTEVTTEPIQNINYWCEEQAGLLPRPQNDDDIIPSVWYYEVRMNWRSFQNEASIEQRSSNVIYEESFSTAWNNNLFPTAVENYREKARAVEIDKSNLYNVTQKIAEVFQVFCRYEYLYDSNYHIIGRLIIFYNNFVQEEEGIYSFQYPYSTKKVSRKMECENVTTQLFVMDADSPDTMAGYSSIMNSPANASREDYILNFDYLYSSGTITREQYDAITPYEIKMRQFNNELIVLQQTRDTYELQIPEIEGKATIAKNSIALDEEQILQNNNLLNALDIVDGDADGYIQLTSANPDQFVIMTRESGEKYINLKTTNKGIDEASIKIYNNLQFTDNGCMLSNQVTKFKINTDDNGNLSDITFLDTSELIGSSNIDWKQIGKTYYVPSGYNGNVDLINRKIVPASAFIAAGYTDFDGTYGTLYSSSITVEADNVTYDIAYTPICADGTVLSEAQVDAYFDKIIYDYPQNKWMSNDAGQKKLILKIAVANSNHLGDWSTDLHERQAEWDLIRAKNDWFGMNSNPSNIAFEDIDYDDLEYCSVANISSNTTASTGRLIYMLYRYDPKLYYQKIIDMWTTKLYQDQEHYNEYQRQLGPKSSTDIEYDLSCYSDGTTLAQAYNKGLYKLLDDVYQQIDDTLSAKEAEIKKFQNLMGPALREGYWQPENYNDYGNHLEYTGKITSSNIIADSGDSAIIAWDTKLFDDELTLYYEMGVNQTAHYYPCINLNTLFNGNIPTDLDKYSVVWKANNNANWNSPKDLQIYSVGSKALIQFIRYGGNIVPVLVLTGAQTLPDEQLARLTSDAGQARLEKYEATVANGVVVLSHSNVKTIGNSWILVNTGADKATTPIILPRIKFSSQSLKTDTSNLIIKYHDTLLNPYNDYYVNVRNTERNGNYYPEFYVTLKPEALIRIGYNSNNEVYVNYVLSNANTSIYLDALKISKENAYPKASYTIDVNVLNPNLSHTLYNRLAQIVMINDTKLKFENVFGYVSQLELDLDTPSNDTLEVKNYKTKFEDLFSTIVAQTEALKRAGDAIMEASVGNVGLTEMALVDSFDQNALVLQSYLDSYFDSSIVVQDKLASLFTEAGQVLSDSNKALHNIRSLSAKNAAILQGFADQVISELTPKVHQSATKPLNFKPGDIWIDGAGNHYIATAFSGESGVNGTSGFVRTQDGSLSAITGAALDINAADGIVDLKAANQINIRSGNSVYIAADEKVDIVGNKEVNIGGTTINIAAEANGRVGGVNIVAAGYNTNNITDAHVAKVLIHPTEITMAGSKITMYTGTAANSVAALELDGANGIWIGSSKKISLFASNNTGNSANVEISPTHILFGMNNSNSSSATAAEITEKHIIFTAGNTITSLDGDNENITLDGSISGVKITKNSIGLATGANTARAVILLNSDGISLGAGADPETSGSYISISGASGLEFGSLADIYFNTNNFKLQTHSKDKGNSGNFSDGETILAVGSDLQYVDQDSAYNVSSGAIEKKTNGTFTPYTSNPQVKLLLNKNGLFINGSVYASTLTATGPNGTQFKANSSVIGFYKNNNAVLTINSSGNIDTNGDLKITSGKSIYIGTSTSNNSVLINDNGIALASSKSIYIGTSTSNNSVLINDEGITLASSKKLNVNTSNVVISSNATGSNTVFQLKNGNTSYLKYTADGKLDITVNSLTIGAQSLDSYISSSVNVSPATIWAGVKSATSDTNLTLTDNSISLKVNNVTAFTLNSDGISMSGKNITLNSAHLMINGQQEWSRDDIIVMKQTVPENAPWQDTMEHILAYMSGNPVTIGNTTYTRSGGQAHDWVLIRPYYDAEIHYTSIFGDSPDIAWQNQRCNRLVTTNGENLSFGDGSTYYTYAATIESIRSSSLGSQQNSSVSITLANSPIDTENPDVPHITLDFGVHYASGGSASGFPQTVSFTSDSSNGHINLCGEGKVIYYFIKGFGNLTTSASTKMSVVCSTDATTSRVPCTVYYNP